MCLLFHKPAHITFDDEHLRDFYSRNQDGYGIMYAEDGFLYHNKELGNVDQWIKFFRENEHREACFHLRMQTHGDINLTNCHPYPVFGFEKGKEPVDMPILLMHNGILHTGNAKDQTKSDTWHYIRDYLHHLLRKDPSLAFTDVFEEIVGKHIGQNRFALMNHKGEVALINEHQGVDYKGVWMSNTYAWSAHKYMPTKVYTGSGGGGSYNGTYMGSYSSGSYSGSYVGAGERFVSGGSWKDGKRGYYRGGQFYEFGDYAKVWDELDAESPKLPVATKNAKKGKKASKVTNLRGGRKPSGGSLTTKKVKKGTIVRKGEYDWIADGSGGWSIHNPKRVPQQLALPHSVSATNTVPVQWVDDVLEVQSILDAVYVDNTTRESQIVTMLDIMGAQRVYAALELILEKHQTTRWWDTLSSSVLEMREFMRHNVNDYKKREPQEDPVMVQ